MPAHSPEELHAIINRCVNEGDTDTLMGLYEPDAVMLAGPGKEAAGLAAIKEAFMGFLALKGRLEMQPTRVLRAGDTALLLAKWTLTGTGPDGAAVALQGVTTDVARRQPDGTWKMVIDSPFGVEGM